MTSKQQQKEVSKLSPAAAQRAGIHRADQLLQQGCQAVVSYREHSPGIAALYRLGAHCTKADFTSLADIARVC
ncbi:hypothetical protein [Alishewanella longhuensis]